MWDNCWAFGVKFVCSLYKEGIKAFGKSLSESARDFAYAKFCNPKFGICMHIFWNCIWAFGEYHGLSYFITKMPKSSSYRVLDSVIEDIGQLLTKITIDYGFVNLDGYPWVLPLGGAIIKAIFGTRSGLLCAWKQWILYGMLPPRHSAKVFLRASVT